MTPQAAAEKAFKRVEEIFAKYPIALGSTDKRCAAASATEDGGNG